jgi:AraC-like DNA-binding protein/mannose-6-phosphate isomerase-like protein (cupin superfamily)
MKQEERTICFDKELEIEAYHFKGIMQKFPNHFHEHYVIGFIESGRRRLSCKNKEYTISTGDLLLFNPMNNHTCEQLDDKALDYRCINIKPEVMQKIVLEITGQSFLPEFTQPVAFHSEQVSLLRELHQMLMEGRTDFEKEEAFYFLIEQLLTEYTKPVQSELSEGSDEIQKACDYMDGNFIDLITLDDLSQVSGLKKYTLLRNFTRQRGITPYQYLEMIRVNHSKKLLEQGVEPIDAAGQSGFTDQSHFTKFFKNFIGLTPKQYQNIFTDDDK